MYLVFKLPDSEYIIYRHIVRAKYALLRVQSPYYYCYCPLVYTLIYTPNLIPIYYYAYLGPVKGVFKESKSCVKGF